MSMRTLSAQSCVIGADVPCDHMSDSKATPFSKKMASLRASIRLIVGIHDIHVDTMLDAQGRLVTRDGGLFIDVLETAASGNRIAWAKQTICDAPFMTADEVTAYAVRVVKQLNINVTDRCISGTPTRAEYITIANGEASSTLRIDAICRERTDALQMLSAVGQIDLRDYHVSSQGKLKRLDRISGKMFDSTPIVWDGKAYIASRDGFLYCLH